MLIVSRFAPSPTGRLHLGHAYSAVRAYDLAREAGGRFLLRIEDIDRTRSREEFVHAIEEDLRWLGLAWDGPVLRQSERMPIYTQALDRLRALNLLYPCFCTRAEIAASASAPHGAEGPIYPGTCRTLPEAERAARMHEAHCWRLDMTKAVGVALTAPSVKEAAGLYWHDEFAGWIRGSPAGSGAIRSPRVTSSSRAKRFPPPITLPSRSMTPPRGLPMSSAGPTCWRRRISTACSRRYSACRRRGITIIRCC